MQNTRGEQLPREARSKTAVNLRAACWLPNSLPSAHRYLIAAKPMQLIFRFPRWILIQGGGQRGRNLFSDTRPKPFNAKLFVAKNFPFQQELEHRECVLKTQDYFSSLFLGLWFLRLDSFWKCQHFSLAVQRSISVQSDLCNNTIFLLFCAFFFIYWCCPAQQAQVAMTKKQHSALHHCRDVVASRRPQVNQVIQFPGRLSTMWHGFPLQSTDNSNISCDHELGCKHWHHHKH